MITLVHCIVQCCTNSDLFHSSLGTDWEYPGYADHSGTPDDIVSYPLLMEELRNALDKLEDETGKHYGITAALPCGPTHLQNINVPELSKYLSELNVSAEKLRY
jgi:GH18 family chitinase